MLEFTRIRIELAAAMCELHASLRNFAKAREYSELAFSLSRLVVA